MQKTTAQRKIIENVIIEKSAGLNQKIYAIAAGKSVNPQSSILDPEAHRFIRWVNNILVS
jgi:hypothetical protein